MTIFKKILFTNIINSRKNSKRALISCELIFKVKQLTVHLILFNICLSESMCAFHLNQFQSLFFNYRTMFKFDNNTIIKNS